MSEPTIDDAARVLIARSRVAAAALGGPAASSAYYQTVYNAVATRVLADSQVTMTPAERDLVAQFITSSSESEPRSVMLRVRLTESERAELQRRAEQERRDMSEYVRMYAIGPSDREWWRAGAVQQMTEAAFQRHADGQMTDAEYDALRQRLVRLQVEHEDNQLMVLLHTYCSDDEHLNRYPG